MNLLVQTQTQRTALSALMRKSLQILQCSGPELIELLKAQLQDNPFLEADWERVYSASAGSRYDGGAGDDPIAAAAAPPVSLEEQLTIQLNCLKGIGRDVYDAAAYIIGNLDGNGYLRLDVGQIAADLRIAEPDVEEALRIVQAMEPAGVGARSLRECLLIQLRQSGGFSSLAYRLADGYLDEIAAGTTGSIARRLAVDPAEVEKAIRIIRRLNPRPGANHDAESPRYIVPDVIVEREGEQFAVRLNGSLSRAVSFSGYDRRLLTGQGGAGAAEYRVLAGKLDSAKLLIHAISRREKTLKTVMETIVELQIGFLREGRARLAPLTLKTVAGRLGLHESTVSRAIAGKFAQTPQGVLEIKSLFAAGLPGANGEQVSAEAVKETLRRLVRSENPHKPFSDRQLTDLLYGEGHRIARRTVAKYREEMGIAPSGRRAAR